MEKFFKFTYRPGQPVRNYGKVVLLDRHRKWPLTEGVEYIIENPNILELEKCIIIKSGKFLRVDEIPPTYEVDKYGERFNTETAEVSFGVKRIVSYQGEVIGSSWVDRKDFTFGVATGSEKFYNLLPGKERQLVDEFRTYMVWIQKNQLTVLGGSGDFLKRRGFQLQTDAESLKVETAGSGSPENPKKVSVVKLQTLVYQPVYQDGFEPAEPATEKTVTNRIETLSLEESGLPFVFRTIWKSPTIMVGKLTVNGEEMIEGLVQLPGDGTGVSYLSALMYSGLVECPPSTLSDDDLTWLDGGGKLCWIYELTSNSGITRDLYNQPSYFSGDSPQGWVKVVTVYESKVRYIQDDFDHSDYEKLVEEARSLSLQQKLVPNFGRQISEFIQIPSETPFYYGQWSQTKWGDLLQNRFNLLKAEMIEGLTLENFDPCVEMVKIKAEEIKTEIRAEYEHMQVLITQTEESFEKTLAGVQQEFVRAEMDEIRNHIGQAKNALREVDFETMKNYCREAERVIANLQSLAETRKQEQDELMKVNYHFEENATPVGRKEEKGGYNSNLTTSNNPMEEALRKAGLIKN